MRREPRRGARARRAAAAAALLGLLGTTVTACSAPWSGSSGACGARIGYLGAASGRYRADGQEVIGGIRTALAAYNAHHKGCRVSLVVADTQGDPAHAAKAARKLIQNDAVLGVVGPGFSSEALTSAPLLSDAGLVTVSPSATLTALGTQGWRTFFRVVANDDAQGPAAARYLRTLVGARRVVVIDDAEAYGVALARSTRAALGRRAAGMVSVHQGQTDFADTVARIRAARADAVFFAGFYQEGGRLVRQLRAAGWSGSFVAGDATLSARFLALAGRSAVEGAIVTSPSSPSTLDFTAAFQAANDGRTPGAYSAESADATQVLLDALAAGKETRAAVLDFVRHVDEHGITKRIPFDDHGEVDDQAIYAYVVRDGRFQPGSPIAEEH